MAARPSRRVAPEHLREVVDLAQVYFNLGHLAQLFADVARSRAARADAELRQIFSELYDEARQRWDAAHADRTKGPLP